MRMVSLVLSLALLPNQALLHGACLLATLNSLQLRCQA